MARGMLPDRNQVRPGTHATSQQPQKAMSHPQSHSSNDMLLNAAQGKFSNGMAAIQGTANGMSLSSSHLASSVGIHDPMAYTQSYHPASWQSDAVHAHSMTGAAAGIQPEGLTSTAGHLSSSSAAPLQGPSQDISLLSSGFAPATLQQQFDDHASFQRNDYNLFYGGTSSTLGGTSLSLNSMGAAHDLGTSAQPTPKSESSDVNSFMPHMPHQGPDANVAPTESSNFLGQLSNFGLDMRLSTINDGIGSLSVGGTFGMMGMSGLGTSSMLLPLGDEYRIGSSHSHFPDTTAALGSSSFSANTSANNNNINTNASQGSGQLSGDFQHSSALARTNLE